MNQSEKELDLIAYDHVITQNFERQFDRVEAIPFQDSIVQTWDLRPENELEGSVPIIFIPAWGATPHTYKDGLKVYYESGRRVVSFAFPPKVKEVTKAGIPNALATKAAAVLTVLRQKGLTKVDAIGYSEGSIILQLVAHEVGCHFRNLVFLAPTGLTGKESYPNIIRLEILNVLQLLIKKLTANGQEKSRMNSKKKDVKNWISQVGLLKSWQDGILPGFMETHELLYEIQMCSQKHQIGIIAGKNDKMINIKKLHKQAEEHKIEHFYEVDGGHQVFEIDAIKCARLSESLLQKFEAVS